MTLRGNRRSRLDDPEGVAAKHRPDRMKHRERLGLVYVVLGSC